MTKLNAPLYEALARRLGRHPLSFHVPGHKSGAGLPDEPYRLFRDIALLDVTELADTDDLHDPAGPIREAQRLAAASFGADETYFSVGGSTAGNIALIMAVCRPGELLIAQRNVHKSVMNGLALAGARAVFVAPRVDPRAGWATVPALADIEAALARHPEAKALLLSNPNYYGVAADLSEYARLAHRSGIPLIVDEAHGAHYGRHPELPPSALQAGADGCVQSAHKTLPALTMAAMVHVRGGLISRAAVRQALSIVQSSSPSYPVMASIDIARAMLDAHGEHYFASALAAVAYFRRRLQDADWAIAAYAPPAGEASGLYADPLRLLLYDRSGRLSGYRLQELLAECDIWAEMADRTFVVLLFGIHQGMAEADRLLEALGRIARAQPPLAERPGALSEPAAGVMADLWSSSVRKIGEPFAIGRTLPDEREVEAVETERAAGRLAAEVVLPYPPGVPLVYPGERISTEAVRAIRLLAEAGGRFQGLRSPNAATLLVMKETP